MKVIVVFEFEDVEVNSPRADEIVQDITDECYRMKVAFDANACYVEDCVESINHTTGETTA